MTVNKSFGYYLCTKLLCTHHQTIWSQIFGKIYQNIFLLYYFFKFLTFHIPRLNFKPDMHNFSFGIESLLPGTNVGLFDYSHRNLSQVGLYSSPLTLTLKKYLSTTYFYGKHLSDLTPKMHWTMVTKILLHISKSLLHS